MDDLLALIAALFDAFTKRERPASPLGQAVREAFAERVGAPAGGPPKPPPNAPRPSPVSQPPSRAGAAPQPVAMSPVRGSQPFAPASTAPPSWAPEAGRVTALFANPQSLVAAFIVAEVLAKPVALRDPQAASSNLR